MKIKLGLVLIIGGLLASTIIAKEQTRLHLKCYLQLENKSKIVHHFVNSGEANKSYIESLSKRSVFMSDGVTKQKITNIYECVAIKNSFKNKEALSVEKNTDF